MPGEKFHISYAHPFHVTTRHTIPFTYGDKHKKEIDFLIDLEIIAPVTEPTDPTLHMKLTLTTLKELPAKHSPLHKFVCPHAHH